MKNALKVTLVLILMTFLLTASALLCVSFPVLYFKNVGLMYLAMILYAVCMGAVFFLHDYLRDHGGA